MRSEPSPRLVRRSVLGVLCAAVLFTAAHAALIRVGRGATWSAALAVAATNGALWFAVACFLLLFVLLLRLRVYLEEQRARVDTLYLSLDE